MRPRVTLRSVRLERVSGGLIAVGQVVAGPVHLYRPGDVVHTGIVEGIDGDLLLTGRAVYRIVPGATHNPECPNPDGENHG